MIEKSKNCAISFLKILALVVVIFFVIEGGYRLYLKISGREGVVLLKFEKLLEKTWFEPHPYLVYTFKPDSKFTMSSYGNGTYTINKFGFRSTMDYDVKTVTKPKNTLRIATLGGSTTMGVNSDKQIWPYWIGSLLSAKLPDKKIEVLNEGVMGYTSLDNLLDLSLRVIDFDPDIYVIYLGVNDYLAAAPLDTFKTDYSHFRKTLWENLSFSVVELIPDIVLRSRAISMVLYSMGVSDRANLLDTTVTGAFRNSFRVLVVDAPDVNKKTADTIIRNVNSMIGVIRQHNPEAVIVLSSFYDLWDPDYIVELNRELYSLAVKSRTDFVDVATLIPKKKTMVYDNLHFTRIGDHRVAEVFASKILNILGRKHRAGQDGRLGEN
jgi:lysophospholipase L1-like esterase